MKRKQDFLEPCQLDGARRLHNGAILKADPGIGKSRTALAYYYIRMGGEIGPSIDDLTEIKGECKKLYVITTAQKRDTHDWIGEFAPFGLPLDLLTVDSWNNIRKYKHVTDSFFIFDEQRVTSMKVWAKNFLMITRHGNEWIMLSATPGDDYIQLLPLFIANGYFRNKYEFTSNHVVYAPYVKFPKIDRYYGTKILDRYIKEMTVHMSKKRSTNQIHKRLQCPFDQKEYRTAMRLRVNPETGKPIESASSLCYILRKIVNSDPSRGSMVLHLLNQHAKAIIFYNFDYELEILRNLPYKPGTVIGEWNGHKHDPLPDGDMWVYLVQYTAGAEGWNCITTDTIIFYSQNYSYKTTKQASGRTDRNNTPFVDLYYYHLESLSSIDLAIRDAISRKKTFNEKSFNG